MKLFRFEDTIVNPLYIVSIWSGFYGEQTDKATIQITLINGATLSENFYDETAKGGYVAAVNLATRLAEIINVIEGIKNNG